MKKICLIGAGRMGMLHAKNIHAHPNAVLQCVVDENLRITSPYFDRVEKEINPNCDGFIIAAGTKSHSSLIQKLAPLKKPIFCEKPVAEDLEAIDQCIETLEKYNTPCLIGFNRRFDQSFSQLQKEVQRGDIGKLHSLVITSRDNPIPSLSFLKTSGGIFKDMCIHDLDLASWILNEEITEIFATGSCMIEKELESFGDVDTASITLKGSSGALCQIITSRQAAFGYDMRLEAHGELGMLRVENIPPTSMIRSTRQGQLSDCPHYSFPERFEDAYRFELHHFIEDVMEGKPPLCTASDGRYAHVLAEACALSLQEGLPIRVENFANALA